MLLNISAFSAFASNDTFIAEDLYDTLSYEYQKLTGLTSDEAKAIFDGLKDSLINEAEKDYVKDLIHSNDDEEYIKDILYIQDNYSQIIKNIDVSQKEIVDKYILYYALKFYDENRIVNDDNNISPYSTEIIEPELTPYDVVVEDDSEVEIGELARATYVCELRVFSDGTTNVQTGSSGLSLDTGVHSFISVKNISDSSITVGKFSVSPGKTMVLGTWGNKPEHEGLWYNLEAYYVYNHDAYSNRVSVKASLSQSSLDRLNSYIVQNGDQWSRTWNCSTFAVNCWNMFYLATEYELSAGLINTPKNLAESIENTGISSTEVSVPYDYVVYYANGRNTPIRSSEY